MKDFTAKYTDNSDEKILLRKISDLIKKSDKTFSVEYSHFLTPAEQTLISGVDEFFGYCSFDGGYEDAERRLCRISGSEYCTDDGLPLKIFTVKASAADFSHRDILGSLMGLGIKREMVGDIITNGDTAQLLCHTAIADFVEFNLKKIGRYNITIKEDSLALVNEKKTEDMMINISSMRLDCISAECFGLSRSKAAEFIKSGAVSQNWLICTEPSKEVKNGDKISMRGKGKVEIVKICGTSKKGRLFVSVKKYI